MEAKVAFRKRTYTYTLEQLQLLRDCYELNKGSQEPLTSTLTAFLSYDGIDHGVMFWLRFLEKIQADRDFPEKEFSPDRRTVNTSFVVTHKE